MGVTHWDDHATFPGRQQPEDAAGHELQSCMVELKSGGGEIRTLDWPNDP
jgi:hypothetical protein